MTMTLEIRVDDLSGADTQRMIARHLDGMHALSPAESCHALDIDGLRDPSVTFWSAWSDGELAGIAALKRLDADRGEIKSMRVDDAFLGRGVGRRLLERIIDEAVAAGLESLWLETGSTAEFLPARTLYERAGFTPCGPFADYREDPLSVFMTLTLRNAPAAGR
ncbi:putative acetyltransferase [Microbacterium terrae]|nr:putative acetyltransferase [Microbacterium terrae]